jgi:hypothetical protein
MMAISRESVNLWAPKRMFVVFVQQASECIPLTNFQQKQGLTALPKGITPYGKSEAP